MEDILITKKSGEKELFDENKLRSSLEHSGANKKTIDKVINELELYLQNGMSTRKIYKKAYSILSTVSKRTAGRYRLKKAILDLGPTGFPFEKFVRAIIAAQGYQAETGLIIQGKCVQHEVDVVAKNEKKIIIVECKFHRESNRKSDVKVPMYIRSRFTDIQLKWEEEDKIKGREYEPWVVTNTRFTEDAVKFGKCSGLKLVSWDYPVNNGLRNMIDKAGLHPLTSLKTLTKKEKTNILNNGYVLCNQLTEAILLEADIPAHKIENVLFEAKTLTEAI